MTPTGYAVTGASGCLGRALMTKLEPLGRARLLTRTPTTEAEALRRRGHEIVPGDLDDPETLDALVAGTDVVFHCAARLGNADPKASRRVNVDGTARLVEASVRAGVRRFVYVSSISVYSATRRQDGVAIDERDLPERVARLCTYARTKYEGELAVRDLAARHGLEYTIVRPTNVYGPWSQPWFLSWAGLLRRVPIAVGNLRIDVVHVDDVADALVLAGSTAAASGETLHIGHESVVMRDFIGRVGSIIGRRTRILPDAADHALRFAAAASFRAVTGTVPAMPLLRGSVYPHTHASRSIGYAPRVTLDEGFEQLAAWWNSRSRSGG